MESKQILQEFEGVIDSVDYDNRTFWATLYDSTNPQSDLEEIAEFEFAVFSSLDYTYILEGNIFNWIIGDIVDEHNITVRGFSELSFQKRTRKEQAIWQKRMVKLKKETKKIEKMIKNTLP
jgi:hypothetical protein